ncbi:type II secretion system protein [Shewanella waksmanii]|uniref:type II secretion system protein n=1 Tax=Shewanella waksmanii TaxID=213783 RepID=UPI0037367796
MTNFQLMSKQNGFTVMEVLVAGFIMFLVIATTTLIYRGATLSSHKAERSIYINGLVPVMTDAIQLEIRQKGQASIDKLSGSGKMGEAAYSWKAEMIDFQAAPPQMLAEAGLAVEQNNRFKLWQVELDANYKDYDRQYRYVEFSWNLAP